MNKVELFKFLDILYRRRYVCVLTTILVLTIATLVCGLLPKKYRVDSTVFIERSIINDLVKGLAVTPNMEDRISVLKQALFSRDIFSKVLSQLDYDVSVPDSAEFQQLLAELQTRVKLQVKDDNRFIVTMDYEDAAFAQNFINTLITIYVEESISSKRDETFGATRFLDEQVTVFKSKLDDAESAIIDFKRKQNLLFTPEDDVVLAEIQVFNNEIEMLTLSLDTTAAQVIRLERELEKIPEKVTLFSETTTANKVFKIEEMIAHLLLTYTEEHPQILKLRAELEELKKQQEEAPTLSDEGTQTTAINPLHQEAKQTLFELETETTALAARKVRLQELVVLRKAELNNVPEKKKELALLVQQRDSLQKIYEILLLRMEQSEVSKQMEIGDKATTFRIIDPAILPQTPIFPQMKKMFLLTIVFGFGAGIGLALVWEKLDSALISTEQVESFGVTIIGSIPHIAEIETRRFRNKRDIVLFGALTIDFILVTGFYAYEILRTMI